MNTNRIFKNNTKYLNINNTNILLESHISHNEFQIHTTKSKCNTVLYKNKFLHSKYNPKREAENICNTISNNNYDGFIILEMGLGYIPNLLQEHYSNIPIFILQMDERLTRHLLHHIDYTTYPNYINHTILIEPNVNTIINSLYEKGIANPYIITSQAAQAIYKRDTINSIYNHIEDYRIKMKINRNMIKKFRNRWCGNIINNITSLPNNINAIHTLEGLCKNTPILLCAGGPSLEESFPVIKMLSKKFPIVCVDTALSVLHQLDVVPDFVVSVDPQFKNSQNLNWSLNWALSNGASLVMDFTASSRILHMIPPQTPIFFTVNNELPLITHLLRNTNFNNSIEASGTVAHAAWEICRILGTHTIYTIGLDLSFPHKKIHAKAVLSEMKEFWNSSQLNSKEQQAFSKYTHISNKVASKNLENNPTMSTLLFIEYGKYFETKFQDYSHIQTFSLSSRSMKLLQYQYINPMSLSSAPDNRTMIQSRLQNVHTQYQVIDTNIIINNIRAIIYSLSDVYNRIELMLQDFSVVSFSHTILDINAILKHNPYINILQFLYPDSIPHSTLHLTKPTSNTILKNTQITLSIIQMCIKDFLTQLKKYSNIECTIYKPPLPRTSNKMQETSPILMETRQ